jgi:hypothetical protein
MKRKGDQGKAAYQVKTKADGFEDRAIHRQICELREK